MLSELIVVLHSRGGSRGNAVTQMISGQGGRWYSCVLPSSLAKKCKLYGKL